MVLLRLVFVVFSSDVMPHSLLLADMAKWLAERAILYDGQALEDDGYDKN